MSVFAKIGATLFKGGSNKLMDGVSKLQKGKTERISAIRGWAAPILSIAAGFPFCIILWIITKSIWQSADPLKSALSFIETIGSGYFFAIITSLIGGTSAALGFAAKKKFDLNIEREKTVREAIKKDEVLDPFDQAFEDTMGHEGGYANDPDDRGGETYRGIARKHHKGWAGWKLIDKLKRGKIRSNTKYERFSKRLKANEKKLDVYVRDFYEQEFWIKSKADQVSKISRKVALELFDTSVNCGISAASKFFQEGLNLLNHSVASGDLKIDGKVGASTISLLDSLCPRYESQVLKVQNGEQYLKYRTICKKNSSQKKYMRGWMGRV